ncbi:MAG: ribonuclease HII [Pseudomonadota bacterium]
MPDLTHEDALRAAGARRIAGVDEVGRGPLAGPVTVAAVILDRASVPEGIDDSKALTPRRRAALAAALHASAEVAIVHISVADIDRLNILQATMEGMRRALGALSAPPCHALIDGSRLPEALPCPATGLVKGDARSVSIAAASIVAKVARDALMVELAQQHPGYGWDHNAGYATEMHRSALRNLGPTPHHRRSFAPVRNMLWQENSSNS